MRRLIFTLIVVVFTSLPKWGLAQQEAVTDATTVQEGTLQPEPCGWMTGQHVSLMPADKWSLVLYDNASEPCTSRASEFSGSCTPNKWNWTMHGFVTFTNAPGRMKTKVRLQVWGGGGGGSCYGDGSSSPIYCDNQYYKGVKTDLTMETDIPGTDLPIPFQVLTYLNDPTGMTQYMGLWVFAMPIGRPAVCKSVNYSDMDPN